MRSLTVFLFGKKTKPNKYKMNPQKAKFKVFQIQNFVHFSIKKCTGGEDELLAELIL